MFYWKEIYDLLELRPLLKDLFWNVSWNKDDTFSFSLVEQRQNFAKR